MPLIVWIVRKTLPGVRRLLQGEQVRVELVEVLVRLDQEFGDDLVDGLHRAPSWSAQHVLQCFGEPGQALSGYR